ncbi:antibiotic biosynthesis monooxygenase family protein [Bacillus taeanensis]|uniref:Antibiotic biosynthesis monooxygenase n=1 Tax=Bacillus taeanensis TaxID=273032 RepID=A0A366XZG0_9BACI|nr:antibiotic biosynthesis monooxygenase [Bacillus taeanensis]RBW69311.1 antibiotic biosynthesis monooxygenase [Bacillus taeanensis]
MNVYMTFGTQNFLQTIYNKHKAKKEIYLLQGSDSAALLLETDKKNIFHSGRKYEIIEAAGNYEGARFVVIDNIPVEEEQRDVFELRFKNRGEFLKQEPGCYGLRFLRPLDTNTYAVVTLWESDSYFRRWQQSDGYKDIYKHREKATGMPISIFSGDPYIRYYFIYKEDEE